MAVSAVKKEPAKPKQAEAAPAAEPASASAGKKGKKLIFMGLGLLLVLAGGGGGAWWYLGKDAGKTASKAEPEKPPVFAPLDAFTVNLQQEDATQFIQLGLTLRMSDDAAVAQLKLRMPEVRDRILLMLSARKPSELLTLEGKRKLADDIQANVNEILAPDLVKKAAAAAAAAAAAQRAAAKTKEKPAPAAAKEPAEGQEEAQPEQAEAAAEAETPPAAIVLPVSAVLFTSFIIQ